MYKIDDCINTNDIYSISQYVNMRWYIDLVEKLDVPSSC